MFLQGVLVGRGGFLVRVGQLLPRGLDLTAQLCDGGGEGGGLLLGGGQGALAFGEGFLLLGDLPVEGGSPGLLLFRGGDLTGNLLSLGSQLLQLCPGGGPDVLRGCRPKQGGGGLGQRLLGGVNGALLGAGLAAGGLRPALGGFVVLLGLLHLPFGGR